LSWDDSTVDYRIAFNLVLTSVAWSEALGLIETKGPVGAIEAADAMVRTEPFDVLVNWTSTLKRY
jgi:hypothetical protein